MSPFDAAARHVARVLVSAVTVVMMGRIMAWIGAGRRGWM